MNADDQARQGRPEPTWDIPPGLGRSLAIGCAVAAVLSFAMCFGGMLVLHVAAPDAAAFGLFISFWGGLGFGSMFAGVTFMTKAIEADGHGIRRSGATATGR